MTNTPTFFTVRSEGGLLPAPFLERLAHAAHGRRDAVEGLDPGSYHLIGHQRLNEAANHAWSLLLGAWDGYRKKLARVVEGESTTTVTREKWLLPLFQALGYGRLQTSDAGAYSFGAKVYPVSHGWEQTPVHLLGSHVDLDHRNPGVAGAARTSPHSLVQELLNRSPEHLWAFLSNGRRLRILRDNVSLSRQAFVEFDLETMMEGEIYSDFLVLFLLCHQSRVEPREDEEGRRRPETCWLETWTRLARDQGTRALGDLRDGVEKAIETLGRGFLAHRANDPLRQALRSGELATQDYYRQLLRVVYRLIFLFAAEDRELLLSPDAPAEAKELYRRHYSTARLRRLAGSTRGGPHPDLWRAFSLVADKLATPGGCSELALPALGSHLWDPAETADLGAADITNRDLLLAVYHLAYLREGRVRHRIDYKNLGPEELGSVYESLLELHPEIHLETATFALDTVAGHERKTTGSYYTPTSLIHALLDSALDPVVGEAAVADDPETALLALKVCDPACGSGHFLIAAAHRIAKALAAHRTGDDEPSPEALQPALHDVIAHCIYGVDINPMALELCKVNLWLETLEPGKPLAFLDHHLQVGNALLGATPRLLREGIPNAAFKDLELDHHDVVLHYRSINRQERQAREEGQERLLAELWDRVGDLGNELIALDRLADRSLADIHEKEQRWRDLLGSAGYISTRLWADAWCAAFVWLKVEDEDVPPPITESVYRRIEHNPEAVSRRLREEVARLATRYRFFHWHLAFPEVFPVPVDPEKADNPETGWDGGFDVLLGNPPWERYQIEELTFFSDIVEIVESSGRSRKDKIIEVTESDPSLGLRWSQHKRKVDGLDALLRGSGRYPFSAQGKFNSYAVFTELMVTLSRRRVGAIVPTGIATEFTQRHLFNELVSSGKLRRLYDFENRAKLFDGLDSRYRFSLVTIAEPRAAADPSFVFACRVREPAELVEGDFLNISVADIERINPNTKTLPIFADLQAAQLAMNIHRVIPVLRAAGGKDSWNIKLHRMINMWLFRNDSGWEEGDGGRVRRGGSRWPGGIGLGFGSRGRCV